MLEQRVGEKLGELQAQAGKLFPVGRLRGERKYIEFVASQSALSTVVLPSRRRPNMTMSSGWPIEDSVVILHGKNMMKWEWIMSKYIFVVFLLFAALQAWPLDLLPPLDEYRISSGSGYRDDPMGGKEESRLHKGVDLVGPHRAPVKAAAAGIVVEHWPPPNGYYRGHPIYGGLLVIDHLDGSYTLYGHLSSTAVAEGEEVRAGQTIGRQGNSGISTGEHLHFEVIVNPLSYFNWGSNLAADGTAR